MASGRQIAEQNAELFAAWVASKTDDDFRAMASRGVLSRKEIATECGFAKSALDQNPRVKTALRELEDSLRLRGVLPKATERSPDEAAKPLTREPSKVRASLEVERMRRLETDNASLKAENAELKRALEKHTLLREALAQTGRMLR